MQKHSTRLISVIIPCLNEEVNLPKLLQDLDNQTRKDFDVIVVDGKSTDRTKQNILKFKKSLNLKFIEVNKRKVTFQRNAGADHAKSKYLFFLDADSGVEKDCIEKVTKYILSGKNKLYLPYIISDKNTLLYKIMFSIAIWFVITLAKINKPISFGPSIIIEKEFFNLIGKFDEKAILGEDHNLIIRASKNGTKPTFLQDVKTVYSVRRFESRGVAKIAFMYTYFTIKTIFIGGIYNTSVEYKMGGDQHSRKRNSASQ